MTVVVRPIDPETEQDLVFAVLEANLAQLPHRRRFRWLYLANPAGRALSWVAEDTAVGRAIGMASIFPRAVWIGHRAARCGQVGDFAIDVAYRSLGPAVMLQRATFRPVHDATLDFCYDCPPDGRGMAPFRRLGIAPTCQTRRYVRLVRCDRQLEKRLGRNPLVTALATAGNVALARRQSSAPADVEIAVHVGRFDDEFSALDERMVRHDTIRCRRGATDLNWRYRDDPLHAYDVLVARRRGELLAFVTVAMSGDDARVIDLFGDPAPGVTLALLEAAADHARRAAKQTLQIVVADTSALPGLLRRAGFHLRSAGPHVVAYALPGTHVRGLLDAPSSWPLRPVDIEA